MLVIQAKAPFPCIVNGHIESTYSVQKGKWSPPTFVADPYIRVHALSSGLNYGLQAFEGLKAFRTPTNKVAIFRPQKNAARLEHSATFLAIPPVPTDLFLKCVHLAVGANAEYVPPSDTDATMYIRPLLFGSGAQLSLSPPQEFRFCVSVVPIGTYHGAKPLDALVLEDFDRAAPEGTGSVKIGGNYAPVFRFGQNAKNDGFGITLHLDSRSRSEIDEFTTSGFVGVKVEGETTTLVVPDSRNVIKSITSESTCDIARDFGWTVERRRVLYEELPDFTEVIAVGTAASLVPIKSITMRSKGDRFTYGDGSDQPGPAISRLLRRLKGIQMGREEDRFGWLDYVEEPKEFLEQQAEALWGGEVKI